MNRAAIREFFAVGRQGFPSFKRPCRAAPAACSPAAAAQVAGGDARCKPSETSNRSHRRRDAFGTAAVSGALATHGADPR
jgi:hypothetical protein